MHVWTPCMCELRACVSCALFFPVPVNVVCHLPVRFLSYKDEQSSSSLHCWTELGSPMSLHVFSGGKYLWLFFTSSIELSRGRAEGGVCCELIHLLQNPCPHLHSLIGRHVQTSWKLARNDVPGASTMVLHISDPVLHEPPESAAGAHPRETPAGREVCAGLWEVCVQWQVRHQTLLTTDTMLTVVWFSLPSPWPWLTNLCKISVWPACEHPLRAK